MISPARRVAFQILERVETEAAYASDLLAAHTAGMDTRDAGLAGEIVLGSLRHQVQLDYLIEHYAERQNLRLDVPVRVALRMAIYQLRYLSRIPAHAAVGESVELVKAAKLKSAAGLVNAVLRKVDRDPVEWPSRAVALSQPAWLLERWERQFGEETTTRIASLFLKPPDIYIRNPPDRLNLVTESTDVPGAFRFISGDLDGIRVQDISSQWVVTLLDIQPGQSFLDVCSAPGNKTAQAIELGARTVAGDIHLHRLRNVPAIDRVVLDGTHPLPFAAQFDQILVDAPCSGTGTLARNPEIRWRLQPADLEELPAKQKCILRNSFAALKPGGRLVYSTCSLENEENEAVVQAVAGESGGKMAVIEQHRRTPGSQPGDGFYAAVIQRR